MKLLAYVLPIAMGLLALAPLHAEPLIWSDRPVLRLGLGVSNFSDEDPETSSDFVAGGSLGYRVPFFKVGRPATGAKAAVFVEPRASYRFILADEITHLWSFGAGFGYDFAWAAFGVHGGVVLSPQMSTTGHVSGTIDIFGGALTLSLERVFADEDGPRQVFVVGTDVLLWVHLLRAD